MPHRYPQTPTPSPASARRRCGRRPTPVRAVADRDTGRRPGPAALLVALFLVGLNLRTTMASLPPP